MEISFGCLDVPHHERKNEWRTEGKSQSKPIIEIGDFHAKAGIVFSFDIHTGKIEQGRGIIGRDLLGCPELPESGRILNFVDWLGKPP